MAGGGHGDGDLGIAKSRLSAEKAHKGSDKAANAAYSLEQSNDYKTMLMAFAFIVAAIGIGMFARGFGSVALVCVIPLILVLAKNMVAGFRSKTKRRDQLENFEEKI